MLIVRKLWIRNRGLKPYLYRRESEIVFDAWRFLFDPFRFRFRESDP